MGEEIERMEPIADRSPVVAKLATLNTEKEFLQSFIELADGFLFRNPFMALQTFDHGACG